MSPFPFPKGYSLRRLRTTARQYASIQSSPMGATRLYCQPPSSNSPNIQSEALAVARMNDDRTHRGPLRQESSDIDPVPRVLRLALDRLEVVIQRDEARSREIALNLGDHLSGASPNDEWHRWIERLDGPPESLDPLVAVFEHEQHSPVGVAVERLPPISSRG